MERKNEHVKTAGDEDAMFCSICKEAAGVDVSASHKNSFITGNCQLKLESIKQHKVTAAKTTSNAAVLSPLPAQSTPSALVLNMQLQQK